MSGVVPIIVLIIIAVQIYFFMKNVQRMKEYKEIFKNERSWKIEYNPDTDFVSGISGSGNGIFVSIKDSINKYLGGNSGSVIDFSLLKDAVDRHCDSVEHDINTLTPIPLYCGLAGTMAGVIIGLGSLLQTGSITALLSSGAGDFGSAAIGVNDLLSGVAWAMIASISGIFLTTLASIFFKKYKMEGESGKNTFLAWLQAKLLPELPSDTSDALNKLVKNLNKFNVTFANNTAELRGAFSEVNQSYKIQADIIKAVHDMDMMKMATANVSVLRELKDCTDKLHEFNEYLDDIHGYTDAIHTFTTQFEAESDRLHVLEEIRNYFERHKGIIAKDSADLDLELRTSLECIKEGAEKNIAALNMVFVKQAEEFKSILQDERDSFEKVNNQITEKFEVKMSQIPMLEKRLSEIADIPSKLDKLIEKIERSNNALASKVNTTMATAVKRISTEYGDEDERYNYTPTVLPKWMKWTVTAAVVLIAIACISNAVNNIWLRPIPATPAITLNEPTNKVVDKTKSAVRVDSIAQKDSLKQEITVLNNTEPQSKEVKDKSGL